MTRRLNLSPITSLDSLGAHGEMVAFDVGPDGVLYIVFAMLPLDYRDERPGSPSYAKTTPKRPQTYRVIGLSGNQIITDLLIENERFNIHHIQPLRDNFLLVCARSYYRAANDFDLNGRIYTRNGRLLREVLLGDGIQSVQTTRDGVVWTSYFDEGIFGNYGWLKPVGAAGLIAWDARGRKLYEFQPSAGLDSICDCYALNVESASDTWCYYYTEFPLLRLRDRRIESVWHVGLGGSDAFAVSAGYALFRGGYKDRDSYSLLALGDNGRVEKRSTVQLCGQDGRKLVASRVVGRGDTIYLESRRSVYAVDVQSAVARNG